MRSWHNRFIDGIVEGESAAACRLLEVYLGLARIDGQFGRDLLREHYRNAPHPH